MSLPARKLSRPPLPPLDDVVVADLGFILEIRTTQHALRWKMGECHLLWFPPAKACVCVEGAKKTATRPVAAAKGKAADAYRRWSHRESQHIHTLDVADPKGQWISHDTVTRIDYWSDKFDEESEYTHDCTTGPRLYSVGLKEQPRDRVWVIRGGGLQLTTLGLIG